MDCNPSPTKRQPSTPNSNRFRITSSQITKLTRRITSGLSYFKGKSTSSQEDTPAARRRLLRQCRTEASVNEPAASCSNSGKEYFDQTDDDWGDDVDDKSCSGGVGDQVINNLRSGEYSLKGLKKDPKSRWR